MKILNRSAILLVAAVCAAAEEAPKNELAFGLGGIPSTTRNSSSVALPSLKAGPGTALQINYARRLGTLPFAAVYGELNVLASPQRQITTLATFATHDFATLYVTPGIRLKFLPGSRLSPWVVVGGGYGDYEQSEKQIDGLKNPAPRQLGRGVFDIGGGIDYRLWHFVAIRGEVREFYTGSPGYNIPSIVGGQNNVVAAGSFALRWH